MTTLKWILVTVCVAIICSGITGVSVYFLKPEVERIVVKWRTKTVNQYIKVPGSVEEYQKSDIEITATQKDMLVDIIASNKYQTAIRTMEITCVPKVRHHEPWIGILGMAGYSSGLNRVVAGYGAIIGYDYNAGNFSFGPGIGAFQMGDTTGMIIQVKASYRF